MSFRMSKINSPSGNVTINTFSIKNGLTEAQAAAFLDRSVSYLQAARAGRGTPGPRFRKIGPAVVYTVSDLKKWKKVTDVTQAMRGRQKAG